MSTLEPVYASLCAPGSPFELAHEEVLGVKMPVFARRPRSLRELLEAAQVHDEREFLVMGERRITYAAFRSQVAGFARHLADKYGVGPGDRVAILGANAPEWIVAFWAVTSLGGVAVAMNGWWSGDEIEHALEDSDPRLIVGDRKRLERVRGRWAKHPTIGFETALESVELGDPALRSVTLDEDDAACILYTSGTTGRAKGAVLTHRSMIAAASLQTLNGAATRIASGAPLPTTPPCTLLTTPLFHVSGLVAGVVTMLSVGAKVVLREGRFDAGDVLRLIEEEGVTSWATTPTMLHRVVHHPELASRRVSSLSNLGSGGSALSPDLQRIVRELLPEAGIGLGYGLTESGGVATINSGVELVDRPDSSGRPMPGVEVEIRDESGAPLPEGAEGEIFLRSPLVMKGYWRNAAATEETLTPDRWLRTGDVGRLQDGHLFINSRARDLIIRGGENIHPIEVEQALEAHPDVDEAAVVGVDHEELGQEVLAFVVPRLGASPSAEDLSAWVASRLAAFKVPAHWTFRNEPLPRNASGKVLKPQLLGAPETLIRD